MEMKKVRIHVKSYEKNNNEKAAIETVSFGQMAEKNGKFYVFMMKPKPLACRVQKPL